MSQASGYMPLPSFSLGVPALLSGNASPVPVGLSLLLPEPELLLLSKNKKSARTSYNLAWPAAPISPGTQRWRQDTWRMCRKREHA